MEERQEVIHHAVAAADAAGTAWTGASAGSALARVEKNVLHHPVPWATDPRGDGSRRLGYLRSVVQLSSYSYLCVT